MMQEKFEKLVDKLSVKEPKLKRALTLLHSSRKPGAGGSSENLLIESPRDANFEGKGFGSGKGFETNKKSNV